MVEMKEGKSISVARSAKAWKVRRNQPHEQPEGEAHQAEDTARARAQGWKKLYIFAIWNVLVGERTVSSREGNMRKVGRDE